MAEAKRTAGTGFDASWHLVILQPIVAQPALVDPWCDTIVPIKARYYEGASNLAVAAAEAAIGVIGNRSFAAVVHRPSRTGRDTACIEAMHTLTLHVTYLDLSFGRGYLTCVHKSIGVAVERVRRNIAARQVVALFASQRARVTASAARQVDQHRPSLPCRTFAGTDRAGLTCQKSSSRYRQCSNTGPSQKVPSRK